MLDFQVHLAWKEYDRLTRKHRSYRLCVIGWILEEIHPDLETSRRMISGTCDLLAECTLCTIAMTYPWVRRLFADESLLLYVELTGPRLPGRHRGEHRSCLV
jgi:hypothetical protein